MRAIKCDRCEKYYDPYEPGNDVYKSNVLIFAERKYNPDCHYENRQFELCHECMTAVIEFMERMPAVKE